MSVTGFRIAIIQLWIHFASFPYQYGDQTSQVHAARSGDRRERKYSPS